MLVNRNHILFIVYIVLSDCKATKAAIVLWICFTLIGRFQDLASLGIVLRYLMPTTKVVRYVIATIMAILCLLIWPLMALQLHYWYFSYVAELEYYNNSLMLKFWAAYDFLL